MNLKFNQWIKDNVYTKKKEKDPDDSFYFNFRHHVTITASREEKNETENLCPQIYKSLVALTWDEGQNK